MYRDGDLATPFGMVKLDVRAALDYFPPAKAIQGTYGFAACEAGQARHG